MRSCPLEVSVLVFVVWTSRVIAMIVAEWKNVRGQCDPVGDFGRICAPICAPTTQRKVRSSIFRHSIEYLTSPLSTAKGDQDDRSCTGRVILVRLVPGYVLPQPSLRKNSASDMGSCSTVKSSQVKVQTHLKSVGISISPRLLMSTTLVTSTAGLPRHLRGR